MEVLSKSIAWLPASAGRPAPAHNVRREAEATGDEFTALKAAAKVASRMLPLALAGRNPGYGGT
jgi:hypothetical protein